MKYTKAQEETQRRKSKGKGKEKQKSKMWNIELGKAALEALVGREGLDQVPNLRAELRGEREEVEKVGEVGVGAEEETRAREVALIGEAGLDAGPSDEENDDGVDSGAVFAERVVVLEAFAGG